MNELASMLVPLETLPGWPVAEPVSAAHALGLLFGAPLAVIALVFLISRVHHAIKGDTTPSMHNEVIWVNGRRIEPSAQSADSRASIEGGAAAVQQRMEAEGTAPDAGGAGARW